MVGKLDLVTVLGLALAGFVFANLPFAPSLATCNVWELNLPWLTSFWKFLTKLTTSLPLLNLVDQPILPATSVISLPILPKNVSGSLIL